MPARLEQNRSSPIQETLHERVHFFLEEWFASGYLNQRAIHSFDFGEHIVHRPLVSFVKCVWSIAPRTTKVAGGQPDEDAGTSRKRRLALD
jgi:hypothetical protein